MVRFNYFKEHKAFHRRSDGLYQVDIAKMTESIDSLSKLILTLQGDGDYNGVDKLIAETGIVGEKLAADLASLERAKIPVDITFKQGKKVLGL